MKRLKPLSTPHQIDREEGFNSWFYEDENGIQIYSERYPDREVGKISRTKLLGVISRIYGIDFKKYLKEK